MTGSDKTLKDLETEINQISEVVNSLERNHIELCKWLDGYAEKLRHELKVMIAVGIPIAVTAITLIIHFVAR
jgi:hypothetical protein